MEASVPPHAPVPPSLSGGPQESHGFSAHSTANDMLWDGEPARWPLCASVFPSKK